MMSVWVCAMQVARMQRRLSQVWHRFAYMRGKPLVDSAEDVIKWVVVFVL